MNIIIRNTADSVLCQFEGELTFEDEREFHKLLDRIKPSGQDTVTFDLQRLEYIDSAGLGMLLCANSDLEALGKTFHIQNARGQVMELLDLSSMTSVIKD